MSSQLMIVHARKSDGGDYMCQAKIGDQTKYTTATINFISIFPPSVH